MVDRLFDLYNESKRVTVIRTTGEQKNSPAVDIPATPPLPEHPKISAIESKKNDQLSTEINNLQTENASLNKKLVQRSSEVEDLKAALNRALLDFNEKEKNLKQEIHHLKRKIEESNNIKSEVSEARSSLDADKFQELEDLRAELARESAQNVGLRESAEISEANLAAVLAAVAVTTSEFSNSDDAKGTLTSNFQHCCDSSHGVLGELCSAMQSKRQQWNEKFVALQTVNASFEQEIASYNLERDMISRDLASLTSEHEAIKSAYNSLDGEHVQTKRKLASLPPQQDLQAIQTKMDEIVKERAKNMLDVDALSLKVNELQEVTESLDREKSTAEGKVSELLEENKVLRNLTESLKQKIKQMGMAKNDAGAVDFLESFEEVMREEMMAMKAAFEAKLRIAKEESDKLTKKHASDIQRLQSSSSALSMYKM
jgi:chromosome segregation ATPase